MSIRKRLMLWLGSLLVVAVLAMSGLLYEEFAERREGALQASGTPEPAWQEAAEIAIFYGAPTVLILLAGSWWLLGRLLAPITSLTQAAERIHVLNLKEQIPRTGRHDELDRLTDVFNSMVTRLDESVTHIREFTLSASHELKTPLTILRGEIESRLRAGGTGLDATFLASQLDEIVRLTRIVDALSLLSKADTGHLVLAREPVRLDELVRESFLDAQLLASPKAVQVALTACEPTTLHGDRHRLRQLLLNLADNAAKYVDHGGRMTIALSRAQEMAELTITNTGPGIAPEILGRVFDRFYRGDPAHNNAVEGCGLGLSVAQWIVKAHGGTIRLSSNPGVLTTATVRLPAADAPRPGGANPPGAAPQLQ